MTALFIGPNEEAALKAAIERARARPIPWDVLKEMVPLANEKTDMLKLEDRRQREPARPKNQEVTLPPGWRVCVSFEEQPAGLLLHLSISSPRARPPNEFAMRMILAACGIAKPVARAWLEEFLIDGKPGGHALNLLFIERENPVGHG